MKLGFQFVPFPREVWADGIDLTQAEFRLLGWFCCNLKLGVQQLDFNDDHILKGIVRDGSNYPPVGLSRNSMQKARSLLIEKKLLRGVRISGGGGRGKPASWSYSLNLSEDERNVKPLKDCDYTSQSLTINLSESDNVIRNIEEPERTENSPTSSEPSNGTGKKLAEVDKRHTPFKELIFRCYRYLNQSDPSWDGSDAKQLSLLLKATPGLTEQQFRHWLSNYAKSKDITPSARPRDFLPRISNYGSGPRDEWHHVIKRERAITEAPSPGAVLRRQLAEENKRKGLA